MSEYTVKISGFWIWFSIHYTYFLEEHCRKKKPPVKMQHELEKIHKDLSFHISCKITSPGEEYYEVIFSCSNNTALKEVVRELVAAAPSLSYLRFTAFLQRNLHCEGVCFLNEVVKTEELYFELIGARHKCTLRILSEHHRDSKNYPIAVILLLENIIGEETMMDIVEDIEFFDILPNEKHQYPTLRKLPAAIDQFKEQQVPDWSNN